jgi:dehydrogenase/reductase SDR family protein 12
MDILEASVLIDKSAEDIFAFLNVPENHPKFVPGMLEFKKTSPGPLGQVGATARGVRRFLGRKMELPYEITQYEPNTKLGMKGAIGPITFEDGYILDSMGASTRVKFWLRPTLTGLARLARPIVVQMGKAHAVETLDGLKKALESSS